MVQFLPLAGSTAASGASASSMGTVGTIIYYGVFFLIIILIFYFMMIRPQKKREKESTAMRNNLQVGDEIITTGGIVGRVVMIKEDSLIIESGADRNKIRIKKWAIQSNETIHDTDSK